MLSDDGGPVFPAVREGKFGYITAGGQWALPPVWEEAGPFDQGFARVRQGGLQGLIDRKGKLIVPARHEFLRDPKEGLAAFEVDGKVGFYDAQGRVAVAAELDLAEDFVNGAAKAVKDGKAGLMGPKGEWLAAPEWEDIGELGEGEVFAFREGKAWGYRTLGGEVAIKPQFQNAGRFVEGLAPAAQDGRFGYIDGQGAWVIEPEFEQASPFAEGRARVAKGPSRWLIDRSGARQGREWRRIGEISAGLAFAQVADESGYIGLTGELVLKLSAEDGLPFRDGLAQVSQNGVMSYVDEKGGTVWAAKD